MHKDARILNKCYKGCFSYFNNSYHGTGAIWLIWGGTLKGGYLGGICSICPLSGFFMGWQKLLSVAPLFISTIRERCDNSYRLSYSNLNAQGLSWVNWGLYGFHAQSELD